MPLPSRAASASWKLPIELSCHTAGLGLWNQAAQGILSHHVPTGHVEACRPNRRWRRLGWSHPALEATGEQLLTSSCPQIALLGFEIGELVNGRGARIADVHEGIPIADLGSIAIASLPKVDIVLCDRLSPKVGIRSLGQALMVG